MEEGVCGQHVGIGVKVAASLFDFFLDVLQSLEVLVRDGLIDEAPQVLGRLEFGGVGWQVDEAQPFGDAQAGLGVPAWRTQLRSVSPEQPILAAIDWIAAKWEVCSFW